jgi:hypothetical protein
MACAVGNFCWELVRRARDGTTHIVLELMARLAALVPPPCMHLKRFHGVFAPRSKLRAAVTPAHRGMGSPGQGADQADSDQPATRRDVAMTWARRLKRIFGIEIEHCTRCGAPPRPTTSDRKCKNVIATIQSSHQELSEMVLGSQ